MTTLVAVDIGGTHARFALAEAEGGRVTHLGEAVTLKTAEHASFQTAWEDFGRMTGAALPRAAAIAIAGPVLLGSTVLDDQVLVEIAITKSKGHLAAIAGRDGLDEAVTDILIDRGNPEIVRRIIANAQARFSEMGFVKLVNSAGGDKELAKAMSARPDLPPELEPFVLAALA